MPCRRGGVGKKMRVPIGFSVVLKISTLQRGLRYYSTNANLGIVFKFMVHEVVLRW